MIRSWRNLRLMELKYPLVVLPRDWLLNPACPVSQLQPLMFLADYFGNVFMKE